MIQQRSSALAVVLLGLWSAAGCEQTLRTGKAGNTRNAPTTDGLCPAGLTACGSGAFAQCLDLQNHSAHCGTCDHACAPGIACAAGVCQQTVCTAASIPLSDDPIGSDLGTIASRSFPYAVLADVNGDDDVDLVGYGWRSSFVVSLGQPGGGFAAPVAYPASDVLSISVTDVNADGIDDLLLVSSATSWLPPSQVEAWLGHPDGRLRRTNATDLAGTTSTVGAIDVAVGDISGDGLPDLLMHSHVGSGDINVFLSDDTGQLHLSSTLATGGLFSALYIRDWNGDGSPDIGVQTVGPYSLAILYNRGGGTFEAPVDCGLNITLATLLVEDFNRDGWMDLALPTVVGDRIEVALGLGGCAFTPFSYYDVPGGGSLQALRAADLNGDGQLDLVAIGSLLAPGAELWDPPADYVLGLLLGRSDGTFALQDTWTRLGLSAYGADVAVGEVSGDQRPDVLITLGSGQVRTLRNDCQ